jgi:hypothetical protein
MADQDERQRGMADSGDPLFAEAQADGVGSAKDRFREALERKRSRQAGGGPGGAHGDSKIHGEHGAVGGKRTFRRKSGG